VKNDIVFTHADLNPRNILVNETEVSQAKLIGGVLDGTQSIGNALSCILLFEVPLGGLQMGLRKLA
jgi:hypothetical protein